jgi:hypothetical protein
MKSVTVTIDLDSLSYWELETLIDLGILDSSVLISVLEDIDF